MIERLIFILIIIGLLITSLVLVNNNQIGCSRSECEQVQKETQESTTQIEETKQVEQALEEESESLVEEFVSVDEEITEDNENVEKETEPVIKKVHYVDIENMRFAPSELKIPLNSTVVFRNKELAMVHKLYEVSGLFYGPRMIPDDHYNVSFPDSGEYTIFSIMGKDKGTKMTIEVLI